MSDAKSVTKKIKDEEIKFVDLRFTDPRGKMQRSTRFSPRVHLPSSAMCSSH
jgi:glutamine synthetase